MTRVYKFLPKGWAHDDIEKQHIKISRFCDLNDPFELSPFDLSNGDKRDALIQCTKRIFRRRHRPVVFLVQVVESVVVGALR